MTVVDYSCFGPRSRGMDGLSVPAEKRRWREEFVGVRIWCDRNTLIGKLKSLRENGPFPFLAICTIAVHLHEIRSTVIAICAWVKLHTPGGE